MKKACITGGSGYLASALIKLLLENGYHVNATVRNLDDPAKVSHLKELEDIGSLKLFQADLMAEGSFDEAVSGCDYVFHMATPVNVMSPDPENELIKPAIQGTLNVMKSCLKARSTVKRIICTSSTSSVSVNQLKGTGYVLDEESWTDTDFLFTEKPPAWGYIASKTLAEKAAWKFAEENKIDLITISPGLTIGPALTIEVPVTVKMGLSLLSGDLKLINSLKMMQKFTGSISIAHVHDVIRAHIFLAENESASGRYICTAVNTSLPEIASFLGQRYPQYKVFNQFEDLPVPAKLRLSSDKLIRGGFEFKYQSLEEIFDATVECFKSSLLE